jgi:hypothetical protein
MTPQQIYNYLVRNDVPQILAASIAEYTNNDIAIRRNNLAVLIEGAFLWSDTFTSYFWAALHNDIDPISGGQNFWLNPLLLPKKFRPKKVKKVNPRAIYFDASFTGVSDGTEAAPYKHVNNIIWVRK